VKVFYFGCWGGAGHYIWTPSGGHPRPEKAGPWEPHDLDASTVDHRGRDTGRGVVPVDPDEREHVWRLTHRDGWTALGAWDRTCDGRRGSKAVFVAEGEHDEATMRGFAASYFPAVYSRIMRAYAEGLVRS
jgi:hypothetical protein